MSTAKFWAKLVKVGDCWEWTGGKSRGGYGRLKVNGKSVMAHRQAWELINGPIGEGLIACHRCDNPRCCNPEHIFIGTHSDNSRDMVEKNRQATGIRNGRSTRPEATARGTRNGSHTRPERRPAGERNGRHTKPERTARGEKNGRAKLTSEQVRCIRAAVCDGTESNKVIGARFGISSQHVSRISRGDKWKHIDIEVLK